jgi:hypothetical protein
VKDAAFRLCNLREETTDGRRLIGVTVPMEEVAVWAYGDDDLTQVGRIDEIRFVDDGWVIGLGRVMDRYIDSGVEIEVRDGTTGEGGTVVLHGDLQAVILGDHPAWPLAKVVAL